MEPDMTPWPHRTRIAVTLSVLAGYVLLFFLLYPRQGAGIAALAILPVLAAAGLWGLRAGLLAGLFSIPLNTLLLNLVGYSPSGWAVIIRGQGAAAGTLAVVLIGVVMGYMSDVRRRMHQELAERRRAEAALRQSERRFRALIEGSSDGIALGSAAGIITYMSPATSRILGYSDEELVGRPGIELVHPADRDRLLGLLHETLQQPARTVAVEYRIQHQDGSWRWVEAVVRNRLADPDVQALVGNYRDITARKRAEEALQARERYYRTLTESLTDYVIHLDGADRIQYINRLAEGYTLDMVRGRHVLEFIAPESHQATSAALRTVRATGQPVSFENFGQRTPTR
jgi:PAS domain S-box-containing protein